MKTPEQKALEARAEVLQKRIAKLSSSREHWRVALERLQRDQDWRKDLKYWAEESQAAQMGAILASVTLMVGASSNDAQAARAAGCPVVLVTYGYNHGQPVRAVDADGFVDSLAQLT